MFTHILEVHFSSFFVHQFHRLISTLCCCLTKVLILFVCLKSINFGSDIQWAITCNICSLSPCSQERPQVIILTLIIFLISNLYFPQSMDQMST